MHILEAAMFSNLRLGPQSRAVARSGSLKDGVPSIMRLAAAVVAIGLVVVGLDSASTGASREETATMADANGP